MTDLQASEADGPVLRTIGRYELLAEIGRGGMAVVYLARQTDLRRNVALKELSALHAADPSRVERFLRESRLAGSLSQPNVVTVHEYFEHEGTGYIAMEYFERGSLRPVVRRLTLAQTTAVLEGLLAGLAAAEARGIVHRDLKPENVMVTTAGGVKITDFGIAKALETLGGEFVTDTGVTVGTPAYMAPEQARGEDIGPWTDLYAAGVMAYEMITGALPFPETDQPLAMMLQHVSEPITPLRSVRPDVDPALASWVERLLVKDTRKRPGDAARAWDELEEIGIGTLGPRWRRESRLVDERLEPSPKVPVRPVARRSGRRAWTALAVAVAVAAGGTAAGIDLTGGGSAAKDLIPPQSEQASLAVAGSNLYLADPGGTVARLNPISLNRKPLRIGPAHPRAIAASGFAAYVADNRSLMELRGDGVSSEQRLGGVVALVAGEDSPVVVATVRQVCVIGSTGSLGPCGDIGFRPVGLGSSPTGSIFVADARGSIAVYGPRDGRLVYERSAAANLHHPHGTLVSSRGRLYVPIERGIAVVDPLNSKLLRVIHLPVTPASIWIGRFSGQLFAALYGIDRVARIGTTSGDATPHLIAGFSRPVAVWGAGGTAYVYSAGDRTLCRLDALTGERLGACRKVPNA